MIDYKFPEGFIWGSASSAYQTEGSNFNNDWYDAEVKEKNKPLDKRRIKEPCGRACDHWNRYEEDYDLAAEMGIHIHRLSIEWSRVFPEPDRVDTASLDHYREMMKALKKRGIKVMLCLHHFTIPRWMEAMGGFENRRLFMKYFANYVDVSVGSVGDLVDYWLPINEPNVVPFAGFLVSYFPPFKGNPAAFIRVYRTFFDMHAQSYHIIKKHFPEAPVGVAFAFMHYQPYKPGSVLDRWFSSFANRISNTLFFDGVNTGRIGFPLGMGGVFPALKSSMDFVGLNYYSTNYMKKFIPVPSKEGDEVTDMGWIIYPDGIYEILKYLDKNIDLPIIVTENGIAATDESIRIKYVKAHLIQVHRAIQEGVQIKGYMYWSLTDNFEWCLGYDMRFGLVNIDFQSMKREIKEGGRWFSDVIARNGL